MKWDVFNFKVLLYVIGICKVCISVVFDEFYSTSPALFLVRCKKAIAANREKDILWLIFVCCTVLRCVFQLCIVFLMRMLNFYPINFIVFLNIFFALFLSLRQGMYSVCLIWFFACYIVWWFRRDVLYAAISFCQWVFLIFVLNFILILF